MAQIDPHAAAIGLAAKTHLTKAGLTLTQYAEVAPMPRNTLSRRINGVLPFTWPEIARLAEVTGSTLADICGTAESILKKRSA